MAGDTVNMEKFDLVQKRTIEMALNGHNLLITGFPGTGKSHVLAIIAQRLKALGKNVCVTATTGKAAQYLQEKIKGLNPTTVHRCLGLRDGRYGNEELVELLKTEEQMQTLLGNICKIDCLICDEVSMLSKRLLEQIQFILQNTRDNKPFGGIQVILCGDFNQLPPIPNLSYNDDGSYCFKSIYVEKCLHHIQLSTIHRQEEPDMIQAVHEIARGEVSEDTTNLLQRLKRKLPPGPLPVKLFALNIDVEVWNSECLLNMEGELSTYEAIDSGDHERMKSIRAPKVLAVKIGCPVILIVNLSDQLVNGLTGEVESANESLIEVNFPSINKCVSLERYSFTVYDPKYKKDVACRKQFPLNLAFALTVHKAQGLTIERLSVDCRNMTQYGQVAVALSRAVRKKGLQVLHFDKKLVRNPPNEMIEFYSRPQIIPVNDFSCCRNIVIQEEITDVENYNFLFTPFDDDINSPQSDHEVDQEMINVANLLEQQELEADYVHLLPPEIEITELLSSLYFQKCETPQMESENEAIDLLIQNSDITKKLACFLWDAITSLKEKYFKDGQLIENKTISEFYGEVHFVMNGDYVKTFLDAFKPNPQAKNVIFKLSCKIRELVLVYAAKSYVDTAKKNALEENVLCFTESEGGRAKIRHIGGWCISKLRRKIHSKITACLYKQNKIDMLRTLKQQKEVINHITSSEAFLLNNAEDKGSLKETARMQNIRKGLVNISDEAFNFFLLLDKTIRKIESTKNLNLHGTHFEKFLSESLEADANLKEIWQNIFVDADFEADIVNSIYLDVISKYCLMSLSQLRKKFLQDINALKTEAHRKQIKMRQSHSAKSTSKFTFETIKLDKSELKAVSHKRLQSEILSNEAYLTVFSKSDLINLSKAYGIEVSVNKTKKQISDLIGVKLLQYPNMLFPDVISTNVENKPDQSVTSVPSTSSENVEHVEKDKCTERTMKTVKRRKSKGGKGKKKMKASTTSKYPCGICRNECSFDCVGCDGCDTWFHFICIKVESSDELPDEWFCNECKNEMDD